MGRKGLTLMELLVVISLLATLAALLFPVYLRVHSRMYAVSCANQLRQIGLAIKMYIHDQGDGSPYSMPYGLGKLYPHYVKNKDLLVCPYLRVLVPEVVEEMHQISQDLWGEVWSSYFHITPRAMDSLAKEYPGEVISFADIFAKRGDQTPIIWCTTHRMCPESNFSIFNSTKGRTFLSTFCSNYYIPHAPLVILRWGGSTDFVYKGSWMTDSNVLLLSY